MRWRLNWWFAINPSKCMHDRNSITIFLTDASSHIARSWWRHQMETFSALLALCAGNSPHEGKWHGALMFSLICTLINRWVNNREAGDLRRHRAHYDVTVMSWFCIIFFDGIQNGQPDVATSRGILRVNSLGPSDAYVRQETKRSLV